MRIHATLAGSRANGPGLRSVVFVRGCALACPGCQNPLTHPFGTGQDFDPDGLASHIVRNAHPGVSGVTISGGEPMHQAVSLNDFLCGIRARRPDWSIGMFTGYTLAELMSGNFDLREEMNTAVPHPMRQEHWRMALWEHSIKPRLDWAITGRYDKSKPTGPDIDYSLFPHLRMCSSRNQSLWLFTRKHSYDDFAAPMLEVNIDADGLTQISGFPAIKTNEKGNVR